MQETDGYRVNHVVHRQTFRGWRIMKRIIPDYELFLVVKGFGRMRVRDREYALRANDVVLFRPGDEHSLWLDREPYMDIFCIHFDPPDGEILPCFGDTAHVDSTLNWQTLFHQLYDVWHGKRPMYRWRASLYMQLILAETQDMLQKKAESFDVVRISRVLDLIDQDPCREIPQEELMKIAGIRKSAFSVAFRKVTGTTPLRYIIRSRLEKARDLLAESDLPVSAIAEMCGFQDPLYFSRRFRQQFLVSPRRYRLESGRSVSSL